MMVLFSLIEDIAGTIFPSINMILIIIISYQFILLYKKPRGNMYYKPWHGLLAAFIFFSAIQVLTLLRKLFLIVHPTYINATLELAIIISLIYTVFAIRTRKEHYPLHRLNISPKKIKI